MNIRIYFPLFVVAAMAFSCGSSEKPGARETNPPEKEIQVPVFNADSAYAYIESQVNFGPRVPGTPAHAECASWLEATMNRFSDTVIIQAFRARAYDGTVLR